MSPRSLVQPRVPSVLHQLGPLHPELRREAPQILGAQTLELLQAQQAYRQTDGEMGGNQPGNKKSIKYISMGMDISVYKTINWKTHQWAKRGKSRVKSQSHFKIGQTRTQTYTGTVGSSTSQTPTSICYPNIRFPSLTFSPSVYPSTPAPPHFFPLSLHPVPSHQLSLSSAGRSLGKVREQLGPVTHGPVHIRQPVSSFLSGTGPQQATGPTQ